MFGRLESGGTETILGVVFAVAIDVLAPRDWLLPGFYVGFLRLRGSAGRGNWRTTAGHCRTTSRPAVSGSVRQDSGRGSVRQGPRTTPSQDLEDTSRGGGSGRGVATTAR